MRRSTAARQSPAGLEVVRRLGVEAVELCIPGIQAVSTIAVIAQLGELGCWRGASRRLSRVITPA